MEAMVELPMVTVTKTTVVKDQIACWLNETAGSDDVAVRTATLHLEGAQTAPKFPLCLLELAAGGREEGVRVTAATYLKNFVKVHWSSEGAMACDEKREFRNQLVDVLLRVDGLVLKLLAEAFRIISLHDFAKQKTWSELVPSLKAALERVAVEAAAMEEVAVQKAAVEKAAVEENAVEKDDVEKDDVEKDVVENDAVEKDAVEKDAVGKDVAEKDIVEKIDVGDGYEVLDMKTLNCLLGLQTITKPFQILDVGWCVISIS